MRTVEFGRVAAQAEMLRLRRFARRQALRAVYGGVGLVFLIAMLAALHVAGAMALSEVVRPVYAVLIVAGIDLVIALIFVLFASGNTPDAVEREALRLRLTALEQMQEAAMLTSLIGPLLRLIGPRTLYGVILAVLTARTLGAAQR